MVTPLEVLVTFESAQPILRRKRRFWGLSALGFPIREEYDPTLWTIAPKQLGNVVRLLPR